MAVDPLADSSNLAITTLVAFGVISILVCVFVLKPLFSSGQREGREGRAPQVGGATLTRDDRAQQQQQQQQQQQANQANHANQGSEPSTWPSSTRKPPHATKTDALLADGMVSFRHSTAANYETTLSSTSNTDTVAANRKERAKILLRILTLDAGSSPPPRGVTVVVSIPAEDVDCDKLRRILYLLATYFNLVVVLSVNDEATEEQINRLVTTLRGEDPTAMPEAVLPSHRIVAAQSRTGRIALVRQLGRVEFVLDHEQEMKDELDRFGFKVLVYGGESSQDGTSRLATQLS